MSDLDQAREWAESVSGVPATPRAHAAAKMIKALPDQWVDAEKLKAIIADMDLCLKMESTSDFSRGIDNATTSWRDALKALLAPKLPTLAELIEQGHDVDDYLFTWVDTEDGLQLVTMTGDFDDRTIYTTDNRGYRLGKSWEEVIPRPDLPKLQWPGF